MKCYCKKNCIQSKEEILHKLQSMYQPCSECYTKTLKKAMPLKNQIKLSKIDKDYLRCEKCGKRHIDIVMAHILKILIGNNQMSPTSSIRKVGTPLITPAIYLGMLPYLYDDSLVIITKYCDENTAKIITDEIPEVKSVIKGDTDQVVGIIDENSEINNYELLSGCDIRCDIQNTNFGYILIYKNQSKLHIEYPKENPPKIEELDEVLSKYDNPTVLDAMCGPGTLGIYALMKNATKVLFNDLNQDSLDALKTNLEINNIDKERYEIKNENILDLEHITEEKYTIGIVDTFPEIDNTVYVDSLKKICEEVIII